VGAQLEAARILSALAPDLEAACVSKPTAVDVSLHSMNAQLAAGYDDERMQAALDHEDDHVVATQEMVEGQEKYRVKLSQHFCDNRDTYGPFVCQDYNDFVDGVAATKWGDHVEMTACADMTGVTIEVYKMSEDKTELFLSSAQTPVYHKGEGKREGEKETAEKNERQGERLSADMRATTAIITPVKTDDDQAAASPTATTAAASAPREPAVARLLHVNPQQDLSAHFDLLVAGGSGTGIPVRGRANLFLSVTKVPGDGNCLFYILDRIDRGDRDVIEGGPSSNEGENDENGEEEEEEEPKPKTPTSSDNELGHSDNESSGNDGTTITYSDNGGVVRSGSFGGIEGGPSSNEQDNDGQDEEEQDEGEEDEEDEETKEPKPKTMGLRQRSRLCLGSDTDDDSESSGHDSESSDSDHDDDDDDDDDGDDGDDDDDDDDDDDEYDDDV
jgi:hypothetical protein